MKAFAAVMADKAATEVVAGGGNGSDIDVVVHADIVLGHGCRPCDVSRVKSCCCRCCCGCCCGCC